MSTKSVSLESAKKDITASFSLRELSDGESEQVRGGNKGGKRQPTSDKTSSSSDVVYVPPTFPISADVGV
jgi:hypothetical protein